MANVSFESTSTGGKDQSITEGHVRFQGRLPSCSVHHS